MNPKKYNSDEPIETNVVSEPAVAYGYANDTAYIRERQILDPNDDDDLLAMFPPRTDRPSGPQRILQPDDKLRSAITMEELQARIFEDLETFFASKQ